MINSIGSQLTDSHNLIDKENDSLILKKLLCYLCKTLWCNCDNKNEWLSCEDCDNWCCYLCLGHSFNRFLSYFCNNCKN